MFSIKGEFNMSKNSKLMSENLKEEIAKELGVYDQVKQDGSWENVPSKTCGNMQDRRQSRKRSSTWKRAGSVRK